MGLYAVTGGSSGIGAETISILKSLNHEVINIDIRNGDVNADLGRPEGRQYVIEYMHECCPNGLDGFVCNHGIGGLSRFKPSYILAVNYFGAVTLLDGLFDLLKKRNGRCAVTSSGSIAFATHRGKFFVDELLTNCGDETRIGRLVDSFTEEALDSCDGRFAPAQAANAMYVSSKIALAHWVRRVAPSWAGQGVTLNAVAPGAASTGIMHGMKKPPADVFFYPMPAIPDQDGEMEARDIAHLLAFLVLPGSKGLCGSLLYCDAGASAIIDPDKY